MRRERAREETVFSNEATEQIPCTYNGAPMKIAFNARFLAEMLGVLDADEVQMECRLFGDLHFGSGLVCRWFWRKVQIVQIVQIVQMVLRENYLFGGELSLPLRFASGTMVIPYPFSRWEKGVTVHKVLWQHCSSGVAAL